MAEWDPAQYARFADERLRPALDLLARVPLATAVEVIDLGCGAGNVTSILKQRFLGATVIGIDASPAMLARARDAAPSCRFVQADIAAWRPEPPPNLIFSNAALQWVDGHEALFPRLLAGLAPGGALAVQMPAMHDAPVRRLQLEVAAHGPWADQLRCQISARAILAADAYWDLLRAGSDGLDIWETTYLHALEGADPIVEWAAGSSLRPFLEKLPPDLRSQFRAAYAEALHPHYPQRPDGTTLLPFRRLFIVAVRAG